MSATGKIVPSGWTVFGLQFFAASAAVAFAIAVLGPVSGIRFFGYVALTCALAGVALHLFLLRGTDPDAWMVLRNRVTRVPERVAMLWRATLDGDVSREMQPR